MSKGLRIGFFDLLFLNFVNIRSSASSPTLTTAHETTMSQASSTQDRQKQFAELPVATSVTQDSTSATDWPQGFDESRFRPSLKTTDCADSGSIPRHKGSLSLSRAAAKRPAPSDSEGDHEAFEPGLPSTVSADFKFSASGESWWRCE